jgi:formylmethanofuran dehydrogenase subunit C
MSGWRLVLRQQPVLRIDARALQPAVFAALARTEVERFALRLGRDSIALAELFTLERIDDSNGAGLVLEGDLSRFDHLGWCMAEGEMQLHGNVGDYAGGGMTGGRITIAGDAADLTACAMRGGWLEVSGAVGDFAASALPGEMDGMRGGTFVVRGNAGARLADRMRRGTLVVFGDAGDFMASRLVAGTIALGGRCGAHAGWGMRRGSIVFAGAAPALPPTFALLQSNADVFWQLLARDLARFGGPFASLPQRRVQRHAGDLAVLGKGELLMPI